MVQPRVRTTTVARRATLHTVEKLCQHLCEGKCTADAGEGGFSSTRLRPHAFGRSGATALAVILQIWHHSLRPSYRLLSFTRSSKEVLSVKYHSKLNSTLLFIIRYSSTDGAVVVFGLLQLQLALLAAVPNG